MMNYLCLFLVACSYSLVFLACLCYLVTLLCVAAPKLWTLCKLFFKPYKLFDMLFEDAQISYCFYCTLTLRGHFLSWVDRKLCCARPRAMSVNIVENCFPAQRQTAQAEPRLNDRRRSPLVVGPLFGEGQRKRFVLAVVSLPSLCPLVVWHYCKSF